MSKETENNTKKETKALEVPKKRIPYFDDAKGAALEKEAIKWAGTPYVPNTMIIGVGVDCLRLPVALYRAFGLLQGFKFPEYRALQAAERNLGLVLEGIRENGFQNDPKKGMVTKIVKIERSPTEEEAKTNGNSDPVLEDGKEQLFKPKCGSLIVFKVGKDETIHLGLALTSGFIHVMPNRHARREGFTEKWQKRVLSVWEPTVEE